MMGEFQYTEQERTDIAKLAPNLNDADWKELGSLASNCPVLLPRARMARIKQTSDKLAHLLETLSPRSDLCVWSREISQVLVSLQGWKIGRESQARPERKATARDLIIWTNI